VSDALRRLRSGDKAVANAGDFAWKKNCANTESRATYFADQIKIYPRKISSRAFYAKKLAVF
jgi:hypothetical protein